MVSLRQFWEYVLLFAVVVFGMASLAPIWTAWYIGPFETTGERATFWTMLASIPNAVKNAHSSADLFEFYGPQFLMFIVVAVLSLIAGRWIAVRFTRG